MKLKIAIIACTIMLGTCQSMHALERLYIDSNELDIKEPLFHIHTGNNIWIETTTIHRDFTGLYTFERDILRPEGKKEYVKKWKCPYCNMYWDIGQACQNAECPSRY